jgi:hypothetical protein
MTLEERFREVIDLLRREKATFAVAGGLAASIYRDRPRSTDDLDFLLLSSPNSVTAAGRILSALHLKASIARQADLEGGPMFARKRGNTPAMLAVGRDPKDATRIGIDFILPEMPWFLPALDRAQLNRVDFGFGPLPTLTIEDVILAKLYALKNDPRRFKDLDDLQSILRRGLEFDILYLSDRMRVLSLPFPKELEPDLPEPFRKISKMVRRKRP